MAKNNNAPAKAGATPEELEAQRLAAESKAKEESEKAEAEAKAKEEAEKAEAEAKAKEEAEKAEVSNEAEVIPSNIFVAEDGTQVEFAVKHFIFGKRKYTVEEAVAEIPEGLQELYERKSFIFKKV